MNKTEPTEIILIAALAEKDRLIGDGMKLPWHIPEDLKRFKRLTLGHPLIIGRKTFDSILVQFGGPLPGRRHIVLTRNPERVSHPVAECVTSVDEALEAVKNETKVYIAGGAAVYEAFLERSNRLELTIVEGDYQGDTFFPEWEHLVGPVFRLAESVEGDGFSFKTYENVHILHSDNTT